MLDEFLEYPDCKDFQDNFVSENEIKHLESHFSKILDMIYNKKSIREMHWHLEEIASILRLESELKKFDEGEES